MALDVSTAAEAQKLVQRVGDDAGIYKVGLQLFTAEGPGLVRDLVRSGKRIFLDLKLHDIPNTVVHAVKSAVELGVHMLTIHASGGAAMLRAATEAAAGRINILGVTVLTSLNDEDMQEIGISGRVSDQVLRMASLAQSAEGIALALADPLPAAPATATTAKSLGDPGADVTYVPLTPCRLVETRNGFAAVYHGAGAFAPNEIRTYTVHGGNGVCLTQLPASLHPAAIQMQVVAAA